MTFAQRTTDKLDRGLVAMKVNSGVYLSWRLLGSEYYDVTYNVYKDGTLIKSGLTTSNYSDTSGSQTSTYTVSAVVRGKEQAQSNNLQGTSAFLGRNKRKPPIRGAKTPDGRKTAQKIGNAGAGSGLDGPDEVHHLHGSKGAVVALGPGLGAGPLDGLLDGIGGQDPNITGMSLLRETVAMPLETSAQT